MESRVWPNAPTHAEPSSSRASPSSSGPRCRSMLRIPSTASCMAGTPNAPAMPHMCRRSAGGPARPATRKRVRHLRANLGFESAQGSLHHERSALLDGRDVGIHHHVDELRETNLRSPAQLLSRPRRIPDQPVHLRGPEIARVDGDQLPPGVAVESHFRGTLAPESQIDAGAAEGALAELAHGMRFSRRQHEISRSVMRDHAPHAIYIVARITPVPVCIEIPQIQAV